MKGRKQTWPQVACTGPTGQRTTLQMCPPPAQALGRKVLERAEEEERVEQAKKAARHASKMQLFQVRAEVAAADALPSRLRWCAPERGGGVARRCPMTVAALPVVSCKHRGEVLHPVGGRPGTPPYP